MNPKIKLLTRTGAMTALAVLLQWLAKLTGDALTLGIGTQVLVGSLVNLVLFVSVVYCGIYGSLAVGILTPVVAFLIGQMPAPVLIPFVALANAILCGMFFLSSKLNWFNRFTMQIAGVCAAALFKFVYMCFALIPLLPLLGLAQPVINALSTAYGVVQLFAALIGGVLFFTADAALKKAKFETAKTLLTQTVKVGGAVEDEGKTGQDEEMSEEPHNNETK